MNLKHFIALFKARSMEFFRDQETFIWNLIFPVLLVFGFAFVFSGGDQTVFKVGTVGVKPAGFAFGDIRQISFVRYPLKPGETTEAGREKALQRLREHQLDFLVDFEQNTYYINDKSPNSLLVQRLFLTETAVTQPAKQASPGAFRKGTASGDAIRYVDKLVPGVIGMNLMFSCLFGVGYVIVRYRKNGVLKRLKATPVSAATFISAQAISRLVIVVLTSVAVYIATDFFLHFVMKGSYLLLIVLTLLASLCMISLGLVFASRLKSEELANGLINLVTFPMMIGSGVFFSLDGTPEALQAFSKVFPLTHFVEASRAVMLQGAGFMEILPNLAFLAVLTVVFFAISAFTFRWE